MCRGKFEKMSQKQNSVKKTHDKTPICHNVGLSSKNLTDADADFSTLQARSATDKSQLTNQRRIW